MVQRAANAAPSITVKHGQRLGGGRADPLPVDRNRAFDVTALQREQRLVPAQMAMQRGRAVVAWQPLVDERLAFCRGASLVVTMGAAVHRVGVVGREFESAIEHRDAVVDAAGLDVSPTQGGEEPPVVAPSRRNGLEQRYLLVLEVLETAEPQQAVYPERKR